MTFLCRLLRFPLHQFTLSVSSFLGKQHRVKITERDTWRETVFQCLQLIQIQIYLSCDKGDKQEETVFICFSASVWQPENAGSSQVICLTQVNYRLLSFACNFFAVALKKTLFFCCAHKWSIFQNTVQLIWS